MARFGWESGGGLTRWHVLVPPDTEEVICPALPDELADHAPTSSVEIAGAWVITHCDQPPTYGELLDRYSEYVPRLNPFKLGYQNADVDVACTMFYAF